MLKNTLISCAAAVIILLPVALLPVKEIYQIAGTMVQYFSKLKRWKYNNTWNNI